MTKLSVNINKIATIRNSRGGNTPNLLQVAQDAERFGAQGITVHPRPDERHIRYQDVYDLKTLLKTDFNIEGAIYNGESLFLFNRGNGKSKKNVVFTIQGKNLMNEFNILSNDYKLPKIKGVRSSFTDAILVDNKIYFLATAEDTNSTYNDGEILGSFIGCIDTKTMKIDFTKKISDSHKFEGITLYSKDNNKIEFLLCEDNDTTELKSNIYKLKLSTQY